MNGRACARRAPRALAEHAAGLDADHRPGVLLGEVLADEGAELALADEADTLRLASGRLATHIPTREMSMRIIHTPRLARRSADASRCTGRVALGRRVRDGEVV